MSESSTDVLKLEYQGEIAVMTLNNPQRLNALNLAMRELMYTRLVEIDANDDCRAIVLQGAGGNLCSGGDISEMKHREILEGRTRMELNTRIFRLLVGGKKPFVCAVEGNAFGAGVSFVAASDYAVAASNAKFSCAFVNVGLMPDVGGIWSLPRKVGHRRAMEMCAFGEPIDAQEALRIQLINAVCAPGGALSAALEVARKFAQAPALAMAMIKSALNTGNETVEAAITTEINSQSVLQNSIDFAEAARAFVEKRKPVFVGR